MQRHAPLAPLTTFKVGGPADFLLDVDERERAARRGVASRAAHGVPVTVLGGGSNVLVADAGVTRPGACGCAAATSAIDRRDAIRADAGLTINGLVRWTITMAWPGSRRGPARRARSAAPSTATRISGAGTSASYVVQVPLVDRDGEIHDVPAPAMEFGYDYSRLQRTREIVVSADFSVGRGEPEPLRAVARESLAFRKRTQPLALPSAGCIFQNPDPARDRVPDGIPCSAGALVDRAGLKGARAAARACRRRTRNFIVNDGGATAADIRALIERCKHEVWTRFGVALREEIVSSGFDGADPRGCGGLMATLRIEGGRRLSGTVAVEGNKNSALPLIAACLLSDEECVLTNVPRIRDVDVLLEIIRGLGATVQGAGTSTLRIRCDSITTERPDPGARREAARLRAAARPAPGAARLRAAGAAGRRLSRAAHDQHAHPGARWRSAPCWSTSRDTRSMRRTG